MGPGVLRRRLLQEFAALVGCSVFAGSSGVSAPAALGQTRKDDSPPRFEDYPAGVVYKGRPAPPILATPEQRLYRTRIRNGVSLGEGVRRREGELGAVGPNFAGHYIIVEIGCGSPCILMPIVDAVTGRVYSPPASEGLQLSWLGGCAWLPAVEFRVNSNLMIMRPCPYTPNGPVYDHYFLWKNNQWKLLRRILQTPGTPPWNLDR